MLDRANKIMRSEMYKRYMAPCDELFYKGDPKFNECYEKTHAKYKEDLESGKIDRMIKEEEIMANKVYDEVKNKKEKKE